MGIEEKKKYILTLEFDRVSTLSCIASLSQLFQLGYWETVDFTEVEDVPKSLHFLLAEVYVMLEANWFVDGDEKEDWESLSKMIVMLNKEIQTQINTPYEKREFENGNNKKATPTSVDVADVKTENKSIRRENE